MSWEVEDITDDKISLILDKDSAELLAKILDFGEARCDYELTFMEGISLSLANLLKRMNERSQ